MKTIFLLMAQYDGQTILPLERVHADFFAPYEFKTFVNKVNAGDLPIPITRLDPQSQKGPRGIHIGDLAEYIDRRREAAQKEARQLSGG